MPQPPPPRHRFPAFGHVRGGIAANRSDPQRCGADGRRCLGAPAGRLGALDDGVQRGARPHRRLRLRGVRAVVTTEVDGLTLRGDQLLGDLGLVLLEVLRDLRESIWFWQEKTDFGLLRYAHFLALAYLAVALVKGREHRLLEAWARPIVTVGRNSLPIFLLSMGLARVAGALDGSPPDPAGAREPSRLRQGYRKRGQTARQNPRAARRNRSPPEARCPALA